MADTNPFIDKQVHINIFRMKIMMVYYYDLSQGNEKEKELLKSLEC